MKVLSLFSGGGLGDYGLTLAGMEIVGQVEIDEYCQKILSLRWPEVPKWRDIRDVKGAEVIERCGAIDLISGGFPCQDVSVAGGGEGIQGQRSGLWKEYLRLICELRPKYCFVENVSALLGRGLDVLLGDLAESGYDAEWDCIPASELGSPQERDRFWLVAYRYGVRGREWGEIIFKDNRNLGEYIKPNRKNYWNGKWFEGTPEEAKWELDHKSCLSRVDDGTAGWVERLHLCGNGQVVQVVEWIGKRIMEYEKELMK